MGLLSTAEESEEMEPEDNEAGEAEVGRRVSEHRRLGIPSSAAQTFYPEDYKGPLKDFRQWESK